MMDLLFPHWQGAAPAVGALSTTRAGGVSTGPYGDGPGGNDDGAGANDDGAGANGFNLATHVGDDPGHVRRNRELLQALLPSAPVWLEQVHGAEVVDAARVGGVPRADASFSTEPGVVCVVQTADCLPVLFCDATASVVGAAHAGWRGLAAGVLQNTVARMREAGAAELLAWLGPAIGPRQFEVGPEVREIFLARNGAAAAAFTALRGGKYLADINILARQALAECGVARVSGGEFCTVADARRFYSYRRDGVTGRMATLIWIPDQAEGHDSRQ
jgi:YfiH family protein